MANGCTVAKYLEVLSHELVRYDVQTSVREATMWATPGQTGAGVPKCLMDGED